MAVAKDTLLGSNRGKAEVVEAKESTIEGVDLSRVQSFEELAAAITENGGLDSSVGFLTAEYLIGAINEVRQGKIEPTRLTRQGGLRAKVAELMDVK